MMRARWLAIAALVTGFAIATNGAMSSWIDVPNLSGFQSASLDSHGPLVFFALFMAAPLIAGVVFAMLVGARRNYLPPPLLVAVIAAVAAGGIVGTAVATHRLFQIETVSVLDPKTHYADVVPMSVSISPWVAVVGMAIMTVAGVWLGWIARTVKLGFARERARVDHELAVRQADLLPETQPTVPRV